MKAKLFVNTQIIAGKFNLDENVGSAMLRLAAAQFNILLIKLL